MSGKHLLARTGWAAVLGMLIFLVISAVNSKATPIKPDVKRMLRESQQAEKPFIPARAGWSEPTSTSAALHNPMLESLTGDRAQQEFRETLATVATPDPWILVALGMVVVLMRKLRSIEASRKRAEAIAMAARPEQQEPQLAA
jgi:hypothetical protein